MNDGEKLARAFETTQWLVKRFAEGMTTEESLAVPDFRANSFNWVVGHILVSRDRALDILHYPRVLSDEAKALYETGSDPTSAETAVSLEQLLEWFDASQESLENALLAATNDDFSQIYDPERNLTVKDRIEGLHWHETYHLGQLEILRQVHIEREPVP